MGQFTKGMNMACLKVIKETSVMEVSFILLELTSLKIGGIICIIQNQFQS